MTTYINPEANEIDELDLQAAADMHDRLVTIEPSKIDVRLLVQILIDFNPSCYDDAIEVVSEASEIASELLGLLIGLEDAQLSVIDPDERLVL